MAWAKKNGIAKLPVGEAMAAFGQHFIGTPYVAHSLEEPGDEHLVVNLRGFDCLTFVENMLAMARCVRSGKTTFDDFKRQLTLIRYTGGVISGYPSRLHYFTDWMMDNGKKGVVQPLTQELGGAAYTKTIDFMSTHTALLPATCRYGVRTTHKGRGSGPERLAHSIIYRQTRSRRSSRNCRAAT